MENKNLSNHQFPLQLSKGGSLDIHKDKIVGCVLESGKEAEFKQSGTLTSELYQLCDWFAEHGIKQVAMESTGTYWYCMYGILCESGIEVTLTNPALSRQIPGRKTDMNDAHWLCKLLVNGLLRKSFIPKEQQQQLRDLTRSRLRYTQLASQSQNRILKILETCNFKLRSVLSNMNTLSAQAIIAAIAKGETDTDYLTGLLKGKARKKASQMKPALQGRITDHHREMMQSFLNDYHHYQQQITALDIRIQKNISCAQEEEKITALKTIEGIGEHSAQVIIAELGANMDQFTTADHATSWCGLAPTNNESAAKQKFTKARQGNKYLKISLIQIAWACVRTKNSYWNAAFKRLTSRIPKKKAIVAIAHKVLKVIYKLLKTGEPYQKWTATDYYQLKHKIA